MRHRRSTPKLNRTPAHRKAMLRNMVTDLLRNGSVRTTQAKAKAVRPLAERMVTLGKRETLNARRHAARVIRDKAVVRKLFDELAPRYAERPGGYTRIIKLPARSGDGADLAIIEMVEAELDLKPSRKKSRAGGPRTAAQDTAAAATAVESAEETPEEAAADEAEVGPEESEVAADDAPEEEPVEAASEEESAEEPDEGDSEDAVDEAPDDEGEEE